MLFHTKNFSIMFDFSVFFIMNLISKCVMYTNVVKSKRDYGFCVSLQSQSMQISMNLYFFIIYLTTSYTLFCIPPPTSFTITPQNTHTHTHTHTQRHTHTLKNTSWKYFVLVGNIGSGARPLDLNPTQLHYLPFISCNLAKLLNLSVSVSAAQKRKKKRKKERIMGLV